MQNQNRLPIEVKICGMKDEGSIEAAIEGGVRHVGFIFFEKSPRNVSPELAAELAAPIKGEISRVAVIVDADDKKLDEIILKMEPDILQLHGCETPVRAREIGRRYNLPTIKAFAIGQARDFESVGRYSGVVARVLFDAKPPGGIDLPGGNGVPFDWSLFAQWQDGSLERDNPENQNNSLDSCAFSMPMLAGGINRNNILEALTRSNARAIDVSSGVEIKPGVKSPVMIRDFLERVGEWDGGEENG